VARVKILHVVPSYLPAVRYGGPIYSVHGLAAAQAAQGHDVSVFTTNADGPGESNVPVGSPVDIDGVKVSYFAIGSPRRLFRAPAMKPALAKQVAGFDLVHLHSVFLWPTLVAARAAARAGVPYVLSPRGMLVGELIRAKSGAIKRAWLRLFERRTIRDAAAIHVTSGQEAKDFAEMGLTARHIVELPNGVDPAPALGAPSAEVAEAVGAGRYLLYLGRLNWKKNLPALITAVAAVPGLRLILAGNDEEGLSPALVATAEEVALTDRFTLIARSVDGADKEALFGGAAIFALPSLNENFGNTVLEAMVRRVPVVVSSGCGVAEVVREAGSGLVAAPDPGALAEAISALANDPAKAAAMGEAGRLAATERYGWGAVASRMVEAYRAL
jgi:glycosyltransferase involved in cell wall biosynthesis